MSGVKNTNNKNIDNLQRITSVLSLVLSILSISVASWSVIQSNKNAETDRRVDTYTEAIVSLDTLCFYEWSLENGYGETFNIEIDDQWLKNQMLDAVRIKAKLEIFDKAKADSYWSIVSQIFDSEHKFDSEEYEKLEKAIRNEI